jgi:PAS domain S-box-containing protein
MTNILNKLLNSVKALIEADFTCLVKFEHPKFELITFESDNKNMLDIAEYFKTGSYADFSSLQADLSKRLNIQSFLNNFFIHDNEHYHLFSGKIESNFFNSSKEKIHSEFTKNIEEIIILEKSQQNNSLANNDFFQLFANSSEELIFTLDKSGIISYVNKYGQDQLKYSLDEIIGKHFFELVKDQYKTTIGEAFQKLINNKNEVNLEIEIIPKVSVEQLFKIKFIPIFNEGTLDKLLGIGININQHNIEKKRNEELLAKLKEANRINAIERDRAKQQISILSELNNLKNEFISNVSHELRTPLASIIGFSETITEDNDLTIERAKEFNDVILTESKRLAKLINDVIDFSELENEKQSLEKTSVNIIQLLKNSIEHFKNDCQDKKITITNKLPESEIIIFADEGRLTKAFNYLLSNAIKFTDENGRITIIAQEFLKEVELIVSDTGIGIPEQKLPLLFDKFSKVQRAGNNLPGAGFGLVTVKQIVELHKGLIRVKSEVDKGTSFIIRLPKYSFN